MVVLWLNWGMRNQHDKRALPIPDKWKQALDEWCLFLRSSGAKDSTIQKRWDHISHLSRCLNIDDPRDVGLFDITRWAGGFKWSSDTRHSYYVSYSKFFGFVQGAGSVVVAGLPRVRRVDGLPRPCPDSVFLEALGQASPREVVMLLLAGAMGLRACEIARVHRDDISAQGQGWAVASKWGGGALTASWVSKIGSRALGGVWTLHTLRHRFATKAYAVERDILVVQRLLGHASVATTHRYAQPPNEAIRIALDAAVPTEFVTQYQQEHDKDSDVSQDRASHGEGQVECKEETRCSVLQCVIKKEE